MNRLISGILLGLVLAVFSCPVYGALYERGTGRITQASSSGGAGRVVKLIYDDVQDITWLDYTQSEASLVDQLAWASFLGVDFNGAFLDNWRLPSVDESVLDSLNPLSDYLNSYQGPDTDGTYAYNRGFNMTNSELGHLYYIGLGNEGWKSTSGAVNLYPFFENTGPFDNLQDDPAGSYWSGTRYSPNNYYAWIFDFNLGGQHTGGQPDLHYAIAVMDGDVAAAVPLPAAVWLLASGLAGLGLWRRGREINGT